MVDPISSLRKIFSHEAIFIIISYGKKRPRLNGWPDTTLEQTLGPDYQKKLLKGNIGLLLKNGLCCIDLDSEEAQDQFLRCNSKLSDATRVVGSRGCKIIVRIKGEYPRNFKIKDSEGTQTGDWLADGKQAVVHGRHPEGKDYEITVKSPPPEITYDDINWPEGWQIPQRAKTGNEIQSITSPTDLHPEQLHI